MESQKNHSKFEIRRVFMEPALGFSTAKPGEWLQSHDAFWVNPILAFLLQMTLLTSFSRWKQCDNQIAGSWGDITITQEKNEHFWHSTEPNHYTSAMGKLRSSRCPLNQLAHQQFDSRTEINCLPNDGGQATHPNNPSLNYFAVKSEWWPAYDYFNQKHIK